tara:strand:+ start:120 stop:830 length:711 start_codon:yes stop_codon:yes gene_type:complete
MSLNDNLYFLLTPLLIGSTYFSAFENGKTTCKRFTTNYFLYLLTSLSIYFSALKAYDKNIITIDKKYRFPLILLEIALIFSFLFVKDQTLRHIIFVLILLIMSYLQKIFLEKIDKTQIEDILKKMMIIIIICFLIALKFPQYMNNSFLIFLVTGLLFSLLFHFIDFVFLDRKYQSKISSIVVFLFAGFIMYDTNRVIQVGKTCKKGTNPDYLDLVLDMVINIEGLFRNLALSDFTD